MHDVIDIKDGDNAEDLVMIAEKVSKSTAEGN